MKQFLLFLLCIVCGILLLAAAADLCATAVEDVPISKFAATAGAIGTGIASIVAFMLGITVLVED